MREHPPSERASRFTEVEKRDIDGHAVTIRRIDQAALEQLKARIDGTEFTDEMVRGTLETMTAFLSAPLVTDDFGADHAARRQWRNSLLAKGLADDHALLETGIMRGNNLGAVLSSFEALKVMAEQLNRFAVINGQDPRNFWEIVNAGIVLQQKATSEYETMSPEQRIQFVERTAALVDSAAWGLVKLFEKNPPIQARAA